MTQALFKKIDLDSLGKLINHWTYAPTKSKKFLGYAIGVVAGLLIAGLTYGRHLFPWLEKLGSGVQAIALLILSPLFAYIFKMQKDMSYSLFEKGFYLQVTDKKSRDKGQIFLWKDYGGCSYSERGVKVSPKTWLKRSVFLHCTSNRMEVYTLCRERIDAFRFGHESIDD